MISEKQLTELLTKLCAKYGFWRVKFRHGDGLPDWAIYGPNGVHFLVELKSSDKKPSPRQEFTINRLRAMHHPVYVVDCPKYLEQIMHEHYLMSGAINVNPNRY